jgi:hypothetical protein
MKLYVELRGEYVIIFFFNPIAYCFYKAKDISAPSQCMICLLVHLVVDLRPAAVTTTKKMNELINNTPECATEDTRNKK